MNIFSFIDPVLYSPIYTILITALCLFTSFNYSFSDTNNVLVNKNKNNLIYSIILAVFLIIFLGFRPVHIAFIDTGYYVFGYENIVKGYKDFSFSEEWLWNNFEFACKSIGVSSELFLLIIELFYIGIILVICYKLFPNQVWVSLLFFLSSFSFYSYGVNGIRNGLACHIVLLALIMLNGQKYEKFVSILLMIVAYGIHRTTAVPIICSLISFCLIKSTSITLKIWLISIFASLIFGNIVGDYLNEADFFEDKSEYFMDAGLSETSESFSKTGFRFDFLLYSSIPILFIWFLTIRRTFVDKMFNLIANTYILANSFWIMVIRATFSNRFAYLSWFIYPLVIVYPLLRMNIWEDQDKKLALILLAYAGFTFLMNFVYYAQ